MKRDKSHSHSTLSLQSWYVSLKMQDLSLLNLRNYTWKLIESKVINSTKAFFGNYSIPNNNSFFAALNSLSTIRGYNFCTSLYLYFFIDHKNISEVVFHGIRVAIVLYMAIMFNSHRFAYIRVEQKIRLGESTHEFWVEVKKLKS